MAGAPAVAALFGAWVAGRKPSWPTSSGIFAFSAPSHWGTSTRIEPFVAVLAADQLRQISPGVLAALIVALGAVTMLVRR